MVYRISAILRKVLTCYKYYYAMFNHLNKYLKTGRKQIAAHIQECYLRGLQWFHI